jgi:hypothetical protein
MSMTSSYDDIFIQGCRAKTETYNGREAFAFRQGASKFSRKVGMIVRVTAMRFSLLANSDEPIWLGNHNPSESVTLDVSGGHQLLHTFLFPHRSYPGAAATSHLSGSLDRMNTQTRSSSGSE